MRIKSFRYDPQLLARILAIGGTFWALFTLPFVVPMFMLSQWPTYWRAFLYFICGYLVFFGWHWRARHQMPRLWAVLLWFFSIIVNALFLVVMVADGSIFDYWDAVIFWPWWLFATAISVVALVSEFVHTKAANA